MDDGSPNTGWRSLWRLGGAAAFAVLALYIIEFFTFFGMPKDIEGWFALFQRSRLLGLFHINALDVVSVSLLSLIFLALHDLLKKNSTALVTASTAFALLGVGVFVTTRSIMTSATLVLSERFAAAVTDMQRAQILAAGEAVQALGQATPQTIGFFFMAVGVIISSAAALKSRSPLGRVAAVLGICAGFFNLVDDLCIVAAPQVAGVALAVSGVFWAAWWVAVGVRLLALGRPGAART